MPRDYDLNAGAVSGLQSGKGKGKIAGSPEGLGLTDSKWKWKDSPLPREGAIIGLPVGIEGKARRMTSEGRMGAINRRGR